MTPLFFGIGIKSDLFHYCGHAKFSTFASILSVALSQHHLLGFEIAQLEFHQNQIDYILCSQRWRSSIQSTKTRPGADCASDHELLITKFRLKLKKVGKTARPFRYDLNKIPYDYTVEVKNRFNGLDLIDRVPDELWNEVHDIVQGQGSRPSPWERNAKKQNGCLGRPYK